MTDPIDRPGSPRPPAGPYQQDPPIRRKPPAMGAVAAEAAIAGRPAPVARERLVPKPLQRVLGFIILFSTVGMLSCQAFLD